jgi:hypothetical protein
MQRIRTQKVKARQKGVGTAGEVAAVIEVDDFRLDIRTGMDGVAERLLTGCREVSISLRALRGEQTVPEPASPTIRPALSPFQPSSIYDKQVVYSHDSSRQYSLRCDDSLFAYESFSRRQAVL